MSRIQAADVGGACLEAERSGDRLRRWSDELEDSSTTHPHQALLYSLARTGWAAGICAKGLGFCECLPTWMADIQTGQVAQIRETAQPESKKSALWEPDSKGGLQTCCEASLDAYERQDDGLRTREGKMFFITQS